MEVWGVLTKSQTNQNYCIFKLVQSRHQLWTLWTLNQLHEVHLGMHSKNFLDTCSLLSPHYLLQNSLYFCNVF